MALFGQNKILLETGPDSFAAAAMWCSTRERLCEGRNQSTTVRKTSV